MIKKILIFLLIAFVIIQFIKPEKNESNDNTFAVETKYEVPKDVQQILKVACNDCHTNKTEYPWYSNIQPVAWWLDEHVVDGKRHLNLSDFTRRPLAVQNHKFEEIIEVIDENEMPLESYTNFGLHAEANLSPEQKETLKNWAKNQMNYLKATYPADSLIMKRRK